MKAKKSLPVWLFAVMYDGSVIKCATMIGIRHLKQDDILVIRKMQEIGDKWVEVE